MIGIQNTNAYLKASISGLALLLLNVFAFGQDSYRYTVDLTNVQDDKVPVELIAPAVSEGGIEFQMPKVVPGTYSISNFGRFVSEFKAFDEAGNELQVSHDDENRWRILGSKKLHRITYWVEDSWDYEGSGHIFEPGGTNIEEGKNFVINTFGFFGYLENMKELPFELTVKKPAGFYGSTPLIATSSDDSQDKFRVQGYNLLADSPLMYCEPDTSVKIVGGAEVLVSVYSPNKKTSASAIMDGISEILEAQRKYLGGTLPVEKYAFICYLAPLSSARGGMGALEHSYSSFYYMPEVDDASAGNMMKDVAAHEFFHIVTPLSIHSEEIQYFDYIEPKMSKHLWLYEGVTEYSAGHVQACYDLISTTDYLSTLQNKISMSSFFLDTVPFTTISAGCLHEYKNQYTNVYQKGALIGAALDIQLRKHSQGKMGLQDLLRKLEKHYGKSSPFKDEELFDRIAELSFPEIREFFSLYVEGPNPLPYAELFKEVGVKYERDVDRKILTMGRVGFDVNPETGRFRVASTRRMNKFGKDMGYEVGDEFVSFNGNSVSVENFDQLIEEFRSQGKEGDKVTAVVLRSDGKGGVKEKKLKGKAVSVRQRAQHALSINPAATADQIQLRKAWLNDL